MLRLRDTPEIGGADPIDTHVAPRERRWRLLRSRLALGLAPTPAPGLLLLPLGILLGPAGVNVLTPTALTYIDAVTSVALAALGVFVGLGLSLRRRGELRLLAAASVEAGLTIGVVTAALVGLAGWALGDGSLVTWLLALALGICASASSTTDEGDGDVGTLATRIGDLDDVLPIVLGGVVIIWLQNASLSGLTLVAHATGVALVIAVAGWLLVSRSGRGAEHVVFVAGTLLLLGGLAEYLGVSALLTGLVAGAFWSLAGHAPRDRIGRYVRRMQHPLVVLLLVTAGARVTVAPGWPLLLVVYVIARVIAKLAGGWVAAKIAGQGELSFGVRLLPPGVIGVAFALGVLEATGPEQGAPVLTVAVVGSIVLELFAVMVRGVRAEEQA